MKFIHPIHNFEQNRILADTRQLHILHLLSAASIMHMQLAVTKNSPGWLNQIKIQFNILIYRDLTRSNFTTAYHLRDRIVTLTTTSRMIKPFK
jgi:hypothetical protein